MAEPSTRTIRKRRSIAARILIVLLLISLLPLLAVAIFNAVRSLQAVEAVARSNLQQIAKTTASQLDQLIEDTTYDLRFLADDARIKRLLQTNGAARESAFDDAMQVLANITNANATYASAFVAGADGVGVASSNPRNIGQDLNFRDYMRNALAGETYISDMLVGKTTGEAGIYFSSPVRGEADDIVGAVVIKLRGDRVEKLIESVTDVTEAAEFESIRDIRQPIAVIIDENGIIISATKPLHDFLYQSLTQLSPAELESIDPATRYGKNSITSVDLPELAAGMEGQEEAGCVVVTGKRGKFVAGFARMQERPWYVCVTEPLSEFIAPLIALARAQLLGALLLAALAAIVAVMQARHIVSPIAQLTQAATRLSNGDFDTRVDISTRDEIQLLADSFNDIAPKLQEHVRMSKSLALANEIQQNLLPAGPPEVSGLDIAGINLPCDETGGDYFDYIDFRRGSGAAMDFLVGDVTGHGVAAALLMTSGRALLRSGAARFVSMSELVADVNDRLESDTLDGRFMTLFYLSVDARKGAASWCSAGHDPALLYDPQSDSFEDLTGEGFPLGIVPEADFPTFSREDLHAGHILVIGTDGVWEAHDEAGEMFGKERLRDLVRKSAARSAQTIADAILGAVLEFQGDLPREDDITVVVVKLI